MKPFAMPHATPACIAALDPIPAERTVHPRTGGARSGGRGPRPPGTARVRAALPGGESQHEKWSRRARTGCVRHGGTSGGMAA